MNAYWLTLLAAIFTSMVGQVLLKSGATGEGNFIAQLFRPQTIIGLGLYGGAALLYIVALRKIPMSVALPFTAVSYVVAVLVGHFFFGEGLGTQKILAILLISAGVVVLAGA
ncbi:multidrug transporter [Roseomonas sp. SSH11]|uniref:Multidrug transporter n=1 Tax=Pararoseomonas baculiformis TaxID=2820812 RepID=A0ABS4A9V9_9PROT|nr:SMR family transporter [Pararoseomonas baculiformis]MBP0443757.1 multidrug transporter [Pararoseomonas baculiformis]